MFQHFHKGNCLDLVAVKFHKQNNRQHQEN